MLKLSSKSYVTVNGAAMAPQAARARGAICPLKSTRMVAKMTSNHCLSDKRRNPAEMDRLRIGAKDDTTGEVA